MGWITIDRAMVQVILQKVQIETLTVVAVGKGVKIDKVDVLKELKYYIIEI
jgi:hypothetical protein